MSPRLAFALQAARDAARGTLRHFQRGVGFELKSDDSPVTVADKEAERVIRAAIESAFPGEAIFGEEEGGDEAPDRWVIDPIDGTKSFIAGVPLYSTLLSYEQDNVPVLGVCVLPALDEIVYAERGRGCFWNDKPCSASKKTRIEDAIVSCGGHASMQLKERQAAFLTIAERALATRTWTDAYGHALVATGRIEAMIDPVVNHWDVSAMSVIVKEAGASFTDFAGSERMADEAISCAPGLKAQILEVFNK